jgi:hypothetical protein
MSNHHFDNVESIDDLTNLEFPVFDRFSRDVRNLTENLDQSSARKVVDAYYVLQENRMAFAAQTRELEKQNSPHELVALLYDGLYRMEKALKLPLEKFAGSTVEGKWALDQYGIGPVLAAGLLAHVDITKAPTAGSVWRYAGLDPTQTWEKGQKRPFNAEFKTLCWKIGQSFMKFSGKDECFYGQLYKQDKARRIAKNEAGDYADFAKSILEKKNFKVNQTRAKLETGKLSDAQIDAQARRFAVKIFLSHYHAVAYQAHHGEPAPRPYIIAHGDHVHEIAIPGNPFA